MAEFNLGKLGSLNLTKPPPVTESVSEPITVMAENPPQQSKQTITPFNSLWARRPIYFDLETVPDVSRRHLFGLDEPIVVRDEIDPIIENYDAFMKQSIPAIKAIVDAANPRETWLVAFEFWEKNSPKPRKGIFDIVAEVRSARLAVENSEVAKIKKMSVTPEFLKIIAIGIAIGDNEPMGFVVDDHIGGTVSESDLLEWFWQIVEKAQSVIGFNCLGFDLPVIFVRSAILGIRPSRIFDQKPWGTDVVDLMLKRWPKGNQMGLKQSMELYGIKAESELDGSKVFETYQRDPYEIVQYVKSDVKGTQQLHGKWRGFFC